MADGAYNVYVVRDWILDNRNDKLSLEQRRFTDEEVFIIGTYESDTYPNVMICVGVRYTAAGYLDVRFDFYSHPIDDKNINTFKAVNKFNADDVSSLNMSLVYDQKGVPFVELKGQSIGFDNPRSVVDVFDFYVEELEQEEVIAALKEICAF